MAGFTYLAALAVIHFLVPSLAPAELGDAEAPAR
jgi:hypothetical protein